MKIDDAAIKEFTRALIDQGLIIEAGWRGFECIVLNESAPANQRADMRDAFYAGALHLFHSVFTSVEPGEQVTEQEMKRMDMISAELEEFGTRLVLRAQPAEGSS